MKSARPMTFTRVDKEVLYYIHNTGPVFPAKLAKRLNREVAEVREAIERLKDGSWLERVSGAMVDYRLSKRTKITKHRNHTYYGLTRKARLYLRENPLDLDVNLRPPYKQA